jgi:Fe-S cluster biogenesis protein NfuA
MTQDKTMLNRIEKALDQIRPYLEADGGNVEVIEITADNILKVKLLGSCSSCPMSMMTLKAGIEQTIKNEIPEIVGVEAVNI